MTPAPTEDAREKLRTSLLRRQCPDLTPQQGEEAFDHHILLAAAVHRVSRLHKSSGDSDTKGWVRYMTDFFPNGRNGERDALLLWEGWRCTLLKDEQPVVPITHGQPEAHWARDDAGRPCLNLESMYADYAHSVRAFIEHLRARPDRRECALRRWRERAWTVRPVSVRRTIPAFHVGASAATSASVIGPSPQL